MNFINETYPGALEKVEKVQASSRDASGCPPLGTSHWEEAKDQVGALGTPRMKWKSGTLCWNCCPLNLTPDSQVGWMDNIQLVIYAVKSSLFICFD